MESSHTASPHSPAPSARRNSQKGWTALHLLAAVGLLTACTDPDVNIINDAGASVEALTIEVDETVTLTARASGGWNDFTPLYQWRTDDDTVLGLSNRVRVNARAERVTITGLEEGTATLGFGQYRAGGQPISNLSDLVFFTVIATTPFPDISLSASDNEWISVPEADLSPFDSVRIQATLVVTFGNWEFAGDPDTTNAQRDVLELTCSPSGETLTPTYTTFPVAGTYTTGDALTWDVVVDVATCEDGDTAIKFRPSTWESGNLLPTTITLSSSDISQAD